jgi:hypothetical protein
MITDLSATRMFLVIFMLGLAASLLAGRATPVDCFATVSTPGCRAPNFTWRWASFILQMG